MTSCGGHPRGSSQLSWRSTIRRARGGLNLTMFNTGYHIEHHESARTHWSELPLLHEQMVHELAGQRESDPPVWILCRRTHGHAVPRLRRRVPRPVRRSRRGGAGGAEWRGQAGARSTSPGGPRPPATGPRATSDPSGQGCARDQRGDGANTTGKLTVSGSAMDGNVHCSILARAQAATCRERSVSWSSVTPVTTPVRSMRSV